MQSLCNKPFGIAIVVVSLMGATAFSDAKYEGMTFDEAVASFESDLSPANQAQALNTLIQFAVRDQHADEVASILLSAGGSMPAELFQSLDPLQEESLLAQLVNVLESEGAGDDRDSWVTEDEIRHWKRVLKGVFRLALPQRKVFEQTLANSEAPLNLRILARIAVQHADMQTQKVQKWLESSPSASPAAAAEIRLHDIIIVEVDERPKVIESGKTLDNLKYKIGTTVVDVSPNGTILIEGRKMLQTNRGVVKYRLTGRVHAKDIDSKRMVSSEKISDLDVDIVRSQAK